MIKKTLIFSFLLTISFSVSVAAQNDLEGSFTAGQSVGFKEKSFAQHETVTPEESMNQESFLKEEQENEGMVIEDKHAVNYLSPNIGNLSRLYWKKGALELSNDLAIDNYLFINECQIYNKFYEDEFEWMRVRSAAREMLKDNKDGFAEHFKILIPLDLGRYDMKRKGFPLVNNTAFRDLRRVEVGGANTKQEICGNKFGIDLYPRNIVLALNKPFNFQFLKLDEHIAQAFVIRRKYEKVEVPGTFAFNKFERPVFARIRVKVNNYNGLTKNKKGQELAVMIGQIDGIDIFEDRGETRLLTSIEN